MSEPNDFEIRLRRLPLRAVLAFAARNARRVEPLASALEDRHRAIPGAIRIAEEFASASLGFDRNIAAYVTALAAKAAYAHSDAESFARADAEAAAYAAEAAHAAVRAVRAVYAKAETDAYAAVYVGVRDAAAAVAAAACYSKDEPAAQTEAIEIAISAAVCDLERLETLQLGESGTRGRPVDASASGPLGSLWPNGAPEWFTNPPRISSGQAPAPTAEPARLVLEAYVDEVADTEDVATALANLGYALNAYHIAAGGNGLVVEDWDILVPEPEFAGVDEP